MRENKKKIKFKDFKDIILIIVLVGILICVCSPMFNKNDVDKNEISDDEAVTIDNSGIKSDEDDMYEDKDVKDDWLKMSEFSSYNEDRLLIVKIKVDGKCVYESALMKPREVLESDVFESNKIDTKGKSVIGEIHSYTLDKEYIGQTNVVIK